MNKISANYGYELIMASKKKTALKPKAANKNNFRDGLEMLRAYKRRTVVWPAHLIVNEFEFKCTVYDISLGGVRIKLDLPLATGAKVKLKIKDLEYTEALVSWYAQGFVGLRFTQDKDHIKNVLGEHARNIH